MGTENAIRKRLASRLRLLRAELGLTQEAAAARSGLALRHLQKIEAGEVNATLNTLTRLATALGVDAGELLRKNDGETEK